MTRNLKALGLALVAAFALSAVAASAASAQQGYVTAEEPAILVGHDINEPATSSRFTAAGTFVDCKNATYAPDEPEFIEHGTTIEVAPVYKECTATALGVKTEVDMKDCVYTFHLEETTESPADTYGVTTTLHCPGGNPTIFIDGGVFGQCHMEITPDTDYEGLDLTDTTEGDLVLHGAIEGITVHATGGLCPETGEIESTLDVEAAVEGENEAEEPVEIGLSELGESTTFIWGDRGGAHVTG